MPAAERNLGGRPRLSSRSPTVPIRAYVTQAELRRFKAMARKRGMSLSSLVRWCIVTAVNEIESTGHT